jgi:hypothetical protein
MMKRNILLSGPCGILSMLMFCQAEAAIFTVDNFNTNDIVIPVFDSNLGTLVSVDLEVTLLSGAIGVGGGHDHEFTSINSRNNPNVGGGGTTLTSSPIGDHIHTATTPVYTSGGLDLG